uniref:Uncharacterized protein n=1 Tax=Arundo donax TaxID=35708 RepID=A0A0A8ZB34_ARUDO
MRVQEGNVETKHCIGRLKRNCSVSIEVRPFGIHAQWTNLL